MSDVGQLWALPDGAEKSLIFSEDRINFRGIREANQLIKNNLHKISGKYDCIVGIPRSGQLFASIIALHLNVRTLSLDQLGYANLRSRELSRVSFPEQERIESAKPIRILVVDDSSNTGGAINNAKDQIARLPFKNDLRADYCAIYAKDGSVGLDFFFEIVNQPRVFEWNFMHHVFTQNMLFDLDGVICEDGPSESSDSTAIYLNHIVNARPKIIPKQPIGAVVTSRLEKYRDLTAEWLRKNGVVYRYLVMVNLPSAEKRRELGLHGKFKADVYSKLGGIVFIESERWQAEQIAAITRKPVYDLSSSELIQNN